MTVVPAGIAVVPPTSTPRRRVAVTRSSTWLVSDATELFRSSGRMVPAGTVISRYAGTVGAFAASAAAGVAAGPLSFFCAATSLPAGTSRALTFPCAQATELARTIAANRIVSRFIGVSAANQAAERSSCHRWCNGYTRAKLICVHPKPCNPYAGVVSCRVGFTNRTTNRSHDRRPKKPFRGAGAHCGGRPRHQERPYRARPDVGIHHRRGPRRRGGSQARHLIPSRHHRQRPGDAADGRDRVAARVEGPALRYHVHSADRAGDRRERRRSHQGRRLRLLE